MHVISTIYVQRPVPGLVPGTHVFCTVGSLFKAWVAGTPRTASTTASDGPEGGRPRGLRSSSAVEPPIFHAPAIVLAVDHDRDVLHLRLPAGRRAEVVNDGAC